MTENMTAFIPCSHSSSPTLACEDRQQAHTEQCQQRGTHASQKFKREREGGEKSVCEENQVNQAKGTEQELKLPILSGRETVLLPQESKDEIFSLAAAIHH